MVGICTSCNPDKLRKSIAAGRLAMTPFYSLSKEDKEEMLMIMMLYFEKTQAKYPVSTYALYCRNLCAGYVGDLHRQKRMAQKKVDGKVVYFPDKRLDATIENDDGDSMTLSDIIPFIDQEFVRVELLADVERDAPFLYPLFKKVIEGEKLTYYEKTKLKKFLKDY